MGMIMNILVRQIDRYSRNGHIEDAFMAAVRWYKEDIIEMMERVANHGAWTQAAITARQANMIAKDNADIVREMLSGNGPASVGVRPDRAWNSDAVDEVTESVQLANHPVFDGAAEYLLGNGAGLVSQAAGHNLSL